MVAIIAWWVAALLMAVFVLSEWVVRWDPPLWIPAMATICGLIGLGDMMIQLRGTVIGAACWPMLLIGIWAFVSASLASYGERWEKRRLAQRKG